MPLGGSNINWDETSPANTDNLGGGDDAIRSAKTSLRNALDSEHNYPSGGGANTGYHRYGSARPFYDVQSNVSSSGTDGRLYLTSDTSRLFAVGSGGTVLLGAPGMVSVASTPGGSYPQRHYWVEEVGVIVAFSASGTTTITFPNSGFSGVPYVSLSAFTTGTMTDSSLYVNILNATTMRVVGLFNGGTSMSQTSVYWRSLGTRVL